MFTVYAMTSPARMSLNVNLGLPIQQHIKYKKVFKLDPDLDRPGPGSSFWIRSNFGLGATCGEHSINDETQIIKLRNYIVKHAPFKVILHQS